MGTHAFLALDLGAESGRAIAGILDLDRKKIGIREVSIAFLTFQ